MNTETQTRDEGDPVCLYCESDTGLYDFGRDCCVTRFLVNSPDQQIRDRHIAWMSTKIGSERLDMILETLKAAIEEKRLNRLKPWRHDESKI